MATLAITGNTAQLRALAKELMGVCAEKGDNATITVTFDNTTTGGVVGSITGPDNKVRKR